MHIEHVIEAIVDVVLVVDPDGRIALANSAAARATGHDRAALIGRSIGELLEDDHSGLRTGVRLRIAEGEALRREESRLITARGERLPVSVTAAPVVDAAGALEGIVVVARDVRELRAALDAVEGRLGHTRDQLLLAERRATLGTLAGGVGHELRNIAQVHVSAVDVLTDAIARFDRGDPGAPEELPGAVRSVVHDLARVGEHIELHGRRLIQLARPGPDHVHPLDLGHVVRDVVAMLQGAGKLHRIALAFDLPIDPVRVTVNRARIEQIMVNLVVNAADAMGRPGTLAVSLRAAPGGRAVVEVADSGPGIAPEVLARIFEPFFTTKGEAGTGLGLSVARDIVERYGGRLVARSEVGHGTTFAFDLPISTT